jgi:plastocyanin
MRTASQRLGVLVCAGLVALLAGCGAATTPGASPPTVVSPSIVATVTITPPPSIHAPTATSSPTAGTPSGCRVTTETHVATAATIHVTQDKLGFFDYTGPVTIKSGQSVTFVNGMAAYHTITQGFFGAKDDGACADELLRTGASVSITFTKPGTYQFTCQPHPSMQTTVVVK